MDTKTTNNNNGFLFNVDILIQSPSNALALQHLLEILNQSEQVIDFRLKSGLELGVIIEELVQAKKTSMVDKVKKSSASAADKQAKETPAKLAAAPTKDKSGIQESAAKTQPKKLLETDKGPAAKADPFDWIKVFAKDNRLVRLTANRHGKHMSLPCRILNYDDSNNLVNVYHVDEKQVYTFNINEIDDYSVK